MRSVAAPKPRILAATNKEPPLRITAAKGSETKPRPFAFGTNSSEASSQARVGAKSGLRPVGGSSTAAASSSAEISPNKVPGRPSGRLTATNPTGKLGSPGDVPTRLKNPPLVSNIRTKVASSSAIPHREPPVFGKSILPEKSYDTSSASRIKSALPPSVRPTSGLKAVASTQAPSTPAPIGTKPIFSSSRSSAKIGSTPFATKTIPKAKCSVVRSSAGKAVESANRVRVPEKRHVSPERFGMSTITDRRFPIAIGDNVNSIKSGGIRPRDATALPDNVPLSGRRTVPADARMIQQTAGPIINSSDVHTEMSTGDGFSKYFAPETVSSDRSAPKTASSDRSALSEEQATCIIPSIEMSGVQDHGLVALSTDRKQLIKSTPSHKFCTSAKIDAVSDEYRSLVDCSRAIKRLQTSDELPATRGPIDKIEKVDNIDENSTLDDSDSTCEEPSGAVPRLQTQTAAGVETESAEVPRAISQKEIPEAVQVTQQVPPETPRVAFVTLKSTNFKDTHRTTSAASNENNDEKRVGVKRHDFKSDARQNEPKDCRVGQLPTKDKFPSTTQSTPRTRRDLKLLITGSSSQGTTASSPRAISPSQKPKVQTRLKLQGNDKSKQQVETASDIQGRILLPELLQFVVQAERCQTIAYKDNTVAVIYRDLPKEATLFAWSVQRKDLGETRRTPKRIAAKRPPAEDDAEFSVAETCFISKEAIVEGDVRMGQRVFVHPGAFIRAVPGTVISIGNDNVIEDMVTITTTQESLNIGDGNIFCAGTRIMGASRIGSGNVFQALSYVETGAVVGDANVLAPCATISRYQTTGDGNRVLGNFKCILEHSTRATISATVVVSDLPIRFVSRLVSVFQQRQSQISRLVDMLTKKREHTAR